MKVRRIVAFIATLSLVSTMFLPMTSALALDDTAVPETEISVDEAEDIVSSLPEETDTPEKETMVQEEADNMKAESETVEEDAGISVEGNPETEVTAEPDMQSVLPNLMRTFIVKGFDNDEEERNCEVIGNAVKYVPYSFLLFNENYPTKTKEAEPETPVEDKIVEVPTGLKIDGKGSWGNYGGEIYTDGSLAIDGTVVSGNVYEAGDIETVPSSVNGHKIRAILMPSAEFASFFWNNATKVIVPNGIAFLDWDQEAFNSGSSGYKAISYLDAIEQFAQGGITLEIQGWTPTAAESPAAEVVEGRLPEGLQFYPESMEIYGIPQETGIFEFSVSDLYDGELVDENGEVLEIDTETIFELTVESNENVKVFDESDEGYSILDAIGTDDGGHDYVLDYAEIEAAGTTFVADLVTKTPVEIIELMGGNYDVGFAGIDGSYYLENKEVFPNIWFYLDISYDDLVSYSGGSGCDNPEFIRKLENGDFGLGTIEVGCNGAEGYSFFTEKSAVNQITNSIQSTYTYADCAEVLGEFSCGGGTGEVYGGDYGGATYIYTENGYEVLLNFKSELFDRIHTAMTSSGTGTASAEVMREVNPQLFTVWIRTDKSAGDTTETGSTGNSKGILYRSEGEFEQYVNLWLNGQLLVRGEDYDAESGSTKITIYAQTFENKANMDGINTIAAEFRTTDVSALNTLNDTNTMHVTAQNFRIEKKKNSKPTTPSSNNNTNKSTSSTTTSSTDSSTDGPAPTRDQTPYWLYVTGVLVSLVGIGVSIRRFQKISK